VKGLKQKFARVTQPRRMKICLAIPCTGTVRIETLLSVVGILNSTPHDIYFAYKESSYIEWNRAELIRTAIKQGCEKLFFLDSDIMVEGDVINKLLAHNKPFVGAAYNNRKLPLATNVKLLDERGEFINDPSLQLPKELFQCAGVPTGAMLIDIPTVQKLPLPWFDLTYFSDGRLKLGEDIYFCQKLIEHGYEIWCDPTIQIGHVGSFVY
jgi:hypothetical protein